MQSTGNLSAGAGLIDRYLPDAGELAPQAGKASFGYGSSSALGLIDMSSIRAFIWRQRFVLIGVTALVVLAGVVFTMLMTPMYQAKTTLRLDVENRQILEGQRYLEDNILPRDVGFYLRTLSNVISSRSMAMKVVDDLRLHDNPEFLRKVFEDGAAQGVEQSAWEQQRRAAAADLLMANVEVEIPLDSSVFTVTFRSHSARLAAQIADGYAKAILVDNIERGAEANAFAREYLEGQIGETRQQLQEAETRGIAYARQSRIIGNGGQFASGERGESVGTSPTLTSSNVEGINQAYIEARALFIASEQRWRAVADLPPSELAEVQQNIGMQNLLERKVALDGHLADLRERYRDDYPEVREALVTLAQIENDIAEAGAAIKNGIRREYQIARQQAEALSSELERVTNVALDEQDRRVQYNLIDREVSALRNQLSGLLDRYNEISAAANLGGNGITIVDPANVPGDPVSPNFLRNLVLAIVLGGALASVLAFLREALDDRVRSVEEVERKLGVRALGQVPFMPGDLEAVLDDPLSPISEAYSSIRATLDFTAIKKDKYALLVTSNQQGEGKTTTSIALAKKFAALGRKVLLVDLDLRRPSLIRALGLPRPNVGIGDMLFSRVTFAQAIIPQITENLDVLGVSEAPANPVELISSGLLPEFLERCHERYDVVVLDSSPVLGLADATLLSAYSDGVVFVVEASNATSGRAKAALRRLQQVNANILGAVLTKFRALDAGESYSYHYQYYTYDNED